MTAVSAAWGSAGSLGAELTESQAAFRVFAAAGGLVLLGLVLLLLTIWWWRGTRPESPALGPLEVMGDRKWASAAESERRRLLEEFRPEGAEPMNLYVEPEPVDLSVLAREVPPNFDDLREPSIDPEALEIESEAAAETGAADTADEGDGDVDGVAEGVAVAEASSDEVDGTVAMAVPSLPMEMPSPSEVPSPSEPTLRPPVAGFAGFASALPSAPPAEAPHDRHETEAMMSPDRHVSPNAGE